jgi:hypothetical protein
MFAFAARISGTQQTTVRRPALHSPHLARGRKEVTARPRRK